MPWADIALRGRPDLARRLKALGHDVRLIAAKYVKSYSKAQKNDVKDAEALQRPTMRFVAIKSIEQLDQQALHRICDRLGSQRTGIINRIRAFMHERGIGSASSREPSESVWYKWRTFAMERPG